MNESTHITDAMELHHDVTALVLAGGRSRRFGADKARHVVDGHAMIDRVLGAARAVAAEVLVSVRDADARFLATRCVADLYPEAGPLAGLHAGLYEAETPWVLVLACDMPFLTGAALGTLLAARTDEADAVVARAEGYLHPLCACYHTRVLPTVENHLASGTLAMHALLDALETVEPVDLPAEVLRNVNRPSDLGATTCDV